MRKLLITILSFIFSLSMGIFVACNVDPGTGDGGNNGGTQNGDNNGTQTPATNYLITVVYPDGTAVNGHTDGTGGISETEVYVQFCSADGEQCATPVKLGTDGKVTVEPTSLEAIGSAPYSVKLNGLPEGYSFNPITVSLKGSYVFTLTQGEGSGGSTGGAPNYFDLEYQYAEGVEYVSEVLSGASVKEGYNVSFSLSLADNCLGTPVVYANTSLLTADSNGVYTFAMTENTIVRVNGVYIPRYHTVVFDKGDYRVNFYNEDGEELETEEIMDGEEINFTVNASVYYVQEYSVLSNTTVLTPNNDGVYTLRVSEDTTISMYNLVEENGFTLRADGGSGTANDPYKLSRPIDLYYMSVYVNNSFYSNYDSAYYELTADIDMGGEQLFVIGDMSDSGAYFSGNFNGNGHTISNYYISDTIVEQENYTQLFLPWVGLFGVVQPDGNGNVPQIYNLNLENFEINVNASAYDTNIAVGGIVGEGYGVNISGCSTSGTITVIADDNYFGYVGGIIGNQYSAFANNSLRYYSTVISCSSSVDIACNSGYVYAAGGISGNVVSMEEATNALILNCYSTGEIFGAIYTGGIAGFASDNAAIMGCYSTGIVEAYSPYAVSNNEYDQYLATAYAGGIVGYADYNSIVSNCFSVAETYASSVNSGSRYAVTDGIVAGLGGTAYINSRMAIELNCYSEDDNVTFNENFFRNTLNWDEEDWIFSANGYPTINYDSTGKSFSLTIDLGEETIDGSSTYEVDMSNTYIPMSYWYLFTQGGVPEYLTAESGNRSYGYFFDEELTMQVPYGYVPTGNMTIYAGFADYSEVAGTYYVNYNNTDAFIVLNLDGSMAYYDGALCHESIYTYNGDYIYLLYTSLALLNPDAEGYAYEYYFTFRATLEGNELSITDTEYFVEPITAVKEISDFAYGTYYSGNTTYAFNKNGTVLINNTLYTYTINDGTVAFYNGNVQLYTGVVTDGVVVSINNVNVSEQDAFAGVWEKSATSHKQYVFDGRGNWEFVQYGYGDQGRYIIASEEGEYTLTEDYITLDNGTIVAFDESGEFIEIDEDTYYMENSFVGKWRFFNSREPIELELNGIGASGVGTAIAAIGNYGTIYELTYEMTPQGLAFYYQDVNLGLLEYMDDFTLRGSFYSVLSGAVRNDVVFCLYDEFEGEWVSSLEGLEIIRFNGLGIYSLSGNSAHLAVRGYVYINGTRVGTYLLDNGSMSGSFTYNDVVYNISYNEETGCIDVTYGDEENTAIFDTYDAWVNTVLQDGDGRTYSFDGRGKLPEGGTLTVRGSIIETYTYHVDGNGLSISGAQTGTITVDNENDCYVFTIGTNIPRELTIVNNFTGTWLVSAQNDYLVIGEIGPNGVVSGSYLGEDVTFNYNSVGNYLSFEAEGQTLYVNVIGSELTVSVENNNYGNYLICIRSDEADEWMGVYEYENGSGTLTFDGLAYSRYESGLLTIRNEQGIITAQYGYVINSRGVVEIVISRTRFVIVECQSTDSGAFAKEDSSTYYAIVAVDAFYELTVEDTEGNEYLFDGVGGVVCGETEYSYEMTNYDSTTGVYTFTFTDEESEEHTFRLIRNDNGYVLVEDEVQGN